jgi:signal transduction histidine kinase
LFSLVYLFHLFSNLLNYFICLLLLLLITIHFIFVRKLFLIPPRYGGSGLGLAITNQIVRLMGGSVRVETDIGHGSTFFFTVPFVIVHEPPGIFSFF